MFYSGIDQHKRDSFITTYDAGGAIVNQERVPNTPLHHPTLLRPIPGTPQSRRLQFRIQNLSRKNDRAGKAFPNHEDERPIDEERSRPSAGDADSHRRCGGCLGPLFVDVHKGFVFDLADVEVVLAADLRKVGERVVEGHFHAEGFEYVV